MLHEFETNKSMEFMCEVLHEIGVCTCGEAKSFMLENTPEIISKRGFPNNHSWWDYINLSLKTPRIKVLKKCIKETHP